MKALQFPRSSIDSARAQQPKWWLRSMRVMRRVHLYLGLLLMPWVLLFAVTALSFNHPGIWRDLQSQTLSAEHVRERVGFQPWEPNAIAQNVVATMAVSPKGGGYELVPESASFHGWALFARPSAEGQRVVILSLDQGSAALSTRPPDSESAKPPFFGERVSLPKHNTEALAKVLDPIHGDGPDVAAAPLRPHPKIRPELRFQVRDAEGTSWNVVYDLGTGLLDGRSTQEVSSAPTIELLEALHKQHHFPPSFAASSVWALFADLTALTLLFWCFSGLLMWWQMKKLRWVGASVLLLAVVAAGLVMGSTAAELTFPPERADLAR